MSSVQIEYCIGCKWMLRAGWIAQELLSTFEDSIKEVSLRPIRDPAGTFRILLNDEIVLWDRKSAGRFPEAKEVKQCVRDVICPERDLGHSDVRVRGAAEELQL